MLLRRKKGLIHSFVQKRGGRWGKEKLAITGLEREGEKKST